MKLGHTYLDDTFAEAFRMRFARLIVTAHDPHWLDAACREATGYGTSVIACDAEAGVEGLVSPDGSPDGRPGAALMFFGFSGDSLAEPLMKRVGQCLMTCPTTAVYDGLAEADSQAIESRIALGSRLRFFGDGYQKSKLLGPRRFWRVPVMDGEFLVEEAVGVAKGIGGGNLIIQGKDQVSALHASRHAVEAMAACPGVIAPFPGGVVRSGSKVGARYKGMIASTNDAFCPSLRSRVQTTLHEGAHACYEIVIDGVNEDAIAAAMKAAIHTAAAQPGVVAISAGNYGGKLGKFHFHLRDLV